MFTIFSRAKCSGTDEGTIEMTGAVTLLVRGNNRGQAAAPSIENTSNMACIPLEKASIE